MEESAARSRERKTKQQDEGAACTPAARAHDEADDGKDYEQEEVEDEAGTREPYSCAFCRRGFPTAQALGGHMNVHRRHRSAAAAQAGRRSSGCDYDYEQQQYSLIVSTTDMTTSTGGGESLSLFHHHAAADQHRRVVAAPEERKKELLRLFRGGDHHCGKGADEDLLVQEEEQDRRRQHSLKDQGKEGEEELDLELRLGGGAAGS